MSVEVVGQAGGEWSAGSAERAAPLYCPYCGEEDLRPHEDAHGAWECRSCTRVFAVRFVGLAAREVAR